MIARWPMCGPHRDLPAEREAWQRAYAAKVAMRQEASLITAQEADMKRLLADLCPAVVPPPDLPLV